jgi:hypothetical protein
MNGTGLSRLGWLCGDGYAWGAGWDPRCGKNRGTDRPEVVNNPEAASRIRARGSGGGWTGKAVPWLGDGTHRWKKSRGTPWPPIAGIDIADIAVMYDVRGMMCDLVGMLSGC